MQHTMATADSGRDDDLSALAWVHVELRRSLETAHKSLRRYLREAEAAAGSDVDAVDPSVLRSARSQLHQGVGALELVGLPAAARVLRASEAAVQRMVARPALVKPAAVETVERLSFALLDFLARQLAGKPVSPVMLFPQYRAAQQLAGADRIHPADLWPIEWQWLDLPPDPLAQPRLADDEARGAMETLVLALMREPGRVALERMSDFCAGLAAGAHRAGQDGEGPGPGGGRLPTLWQMAAAVFEAQAGGLLAGDLHTKRLASRLLAQLRLGVRGQNEVSDRLAQDLLFFCSHARPPGAGQPAPRLAAVRQAWRLDQRPTADYEAANLGRFDPAMVALARKRVAAAKDAWSAVAGGELHRLAGLSDQFTLVGDSLQRLLPAGEALAQALATTVSRTEAAQAAPAPALAMEVATGMLYVDATLEDGELDHPELAGRVKRLAQRIDDVRSGADPQPLEIWMEELYRRVSDRQTMGSVVQELRASLSEVEKQIDQYFRNPAQRELLIPVPAQLSAMRGVLSVLGMDQASQAVLHMRDAVDELARTEVDPQRAIQAGTFDHLADNLGALSFLIDMLSVQPALAKSLFRFDADSGSLSALMGQSERVSAYAEQEPAPVPTATAKPTPVRVASTLREQVEALAAAAASPTIGGDDIAGRIEGLSQQALTADEPELARQLAASRAALLRAGDDDARRTVRAELAAALDTRGLAAPEALPLPAPMPAPAPAVTGDTGLEDDAEIREIFIEEAREVMAEARAALETLADEPESSDGMTTLRRTFHTLKGSARMVGLPEFGEAAWACEQLYNARLAQAPRVDQPLRLFSGEALAYLGDWLEAIAAGRDGGHSAPAMTRAADSLRLDGVRLPIGAPSALPLAAAPVVAAELPPAVPEMAALREPESETTSEPEAEPATELLDFEFDLGEVEAAAPAAPMSLTLRVPDLPSAADLDFGPPDVGAPAPSDDSVFELDFGGLAASPQPAAPVAAAAEATPLVLLDLPLQAPAAEVGASGLPTPEFEALDMGTRLAVPGFAPPAEAPPAATTVLDFDMDALEAAVGREEAPTEVLSADAVPTDEAVVEQAPAAAEAGAAVPDSAAATGDVEAEDEPIKVIGPLRIGIPLFNIFLNEADELSRRLGVELAEWALEHERHPVPETSVALAHSLAGSSATVGYVDLSALARALEHALARAHATGHGRSGEPELFNDAADEIRRLLHQFAAGFLRPVAPELMERLALHERLQPEAATAPEALPEADLGAPFEVIPEAATAAAADVEAAPVEPVALASLAVVGEDDEIDAVDAIDAELFPIFEEEADEQLPQLQARLREWHEQPAALDAAAACLRTLHTFKGGARLAGAMRLGEMAHRLETAIENLAARGQVAERDVEPLLGRADAMASVYDALRKAPAAAMPSLPAAALEPAVGRSVEAPAVPTARIGPAATPAAPAVSAQAEPEPVAAPTAEPPTVPVAEPAVLAAPTPLAIDWRRFVAAESATADPAAAAAERPAAGTAVVRVRASLLDRLVNQAGEVSITRARMDADVRQLQGWLAELTESLDRMRRQLRDIELQAETQISSRMEAAKVAAQTFDPLEMDRFTRFQELTRFMAESVNDVATLHRSLQRTLQSTEDELAAQARLTRELQDDLLRTRMVEFESMADRLYRTVRQAAKDAGKQVRLDIEGGAIEIDRGVLERMGGSFEHLLRNAVAHGIEAPRQREQAGKDAGGRITIAVAQAGNEVALEFADDGAGLDLQRIRRRGVELGLVAPEQPASDAELAQLIFSPGFSTAQSVTELAGRGVGLDVVRSEVNAMGGRIETVSSAAQGTRFRLLLPLTTAVTQVVMLRCGELQVAVPSTLVEVVRRVTSTDLERAYGEGTIEHGGETVPFFWLAALLQAGTRGGADGRAQAVVVIRSAAQRVAVHVDEVVGNQEVVVKNVGPQLARLPGLAGVTLLPSGAVALIYNPVALASVYGEQARALARSGVPVAGIEAAAAEPTHAPLVMVVDDSLTVRRVTQRLLVREGYRVALAKDGLDALEQLGTERPVVLLSDIEMPRMDGFDLVRNVRADPRLADLPVVMITSRIAQKHRDYAAELGVQHYLGKPYSEDELLSLVAQYAGAEAPDILA
jgi:chemosensory pili system protein ChpA (sensor histidine kinase/response regulator)